MHNKTNAVAFALIALIAGPTACSQDEPTPFDEPTPVDPPVACDFGFFAVDGACQDIDECAGDNICAPVASCTNTEGAYTCECPADHIDFNGDGTSCIVDPSAGNTCQNPFIIDNAALPYAIAGDTRNASNSYGFGAGQCGSVQPTGTASADHVYALTAEHSGTYTISLTPDGWGSALYVVGDCADIGESCMGARDEACADCTETLELNLQAGQTYFVVVDGYSDQFNEAGSYELEVIPPEGTYVPVEGVVGHYRGDGMDQSGHGNHAAANGTITVVPDRFGNPGQAASFGGSDYYEVLNHPLLPEGAEPRTVSVWVRTSESAVHQSFLNWGRTAQGERFGFLVLSDGSPYFAGQWADMGSTTQGLDDGAWHHFASTYDGTTVTILIDGAIDGSQELSLNTVGTNLEIGRTAFDHGAEPFSGVLDDLRIYDRVLSPAELGALYAEDGWE